jgi:hypothetical protein
MPSLANSYLFTGANYSELTWSLLIAAQNWGLKMSKTGKKCDRKQSSL